MQLQFQLTETQYIAAQHLYARRSPVVKRSLAIIGAVCMTPLALGAWLLHLGALTPRLAVACFALPIAFAVLLKVWVRINAGVDWFHHRALQAPMDFRFDADGFDSISKTRAIRVAYHDCLDWFEDDRFVLLLRTPATFYILPKTAFAIPGDVEVLRGWFHRARSGVDLEKQTSVLSPESAAADHPASSAPLWQIEYQLGEREALAADWLRFRSLWHGPIAWIVAVAVAYLVAQCTWSVYQDPNNWSQAVTLSVGIAGFLGMMVLFARRRTKLDLLAGGLIDTPIVAALYRASLRLRTRGSWQRIKLSRIEQIAENSSLLVLIERTGRWYALPKRAFTSPDQIRLLQQLVSRG